MAIFLEVFGAVLAALIVHSIGKWLVISYVRYRQEREIYKRINPEA